MGDLNTRHRVPDEATEEVRGRRNRVPKYLYDMLPEAHHSSAEQRHASSIPAKTALDRAKPTPEEQYVILSLQQRRVYLFRCGGCGAGAVRIRRVLVMGIHGVARRVYGWKTSAADYWLPRYHSACRG